MITSSTANVGPHAHASPPEPPHFNVDGPKDAHPQLGKWQSMPDRTNIDMGAQGVYSYIQTLLILDKELTTRPQFLEPRLLQVMFDCIAIAPFTPRVWTYALILQTIPPR